MPSHGYLWNLTEWLTRLGFNRTDLPEIAYSVQPVQVVGDASALTSPLLPPLAWLGSNHIPVAGQLSSLAIRSLAPGGTFVRALRSTSPFTVTYVWQVNVAPVALTTTTVLTAFNMGPTPIASTVTTYRHRSSDVHCAREFPERTDR